MFCFSLLGTFPAFAATTVQAYMVNYPRQNDPNYGDSRFGHSANYLMSGWAYVAYERMTLHAIGSYNGQIVKTTDDGNVEGFAFRVSGVNSYDMTFTTDANGEILIEGLRIGEYVVTELENGASEGYEIAEPVTVTLVANETLTVNVHNNKITVDVPKTGDGIYTYDDLFQIGCIGLCKAAATDKGGCFSTYAYRLIRNEIYSALIYANRRAGKEVPTEPEVLSTYEADIVPEQLDNTLTALLDEAESSAAGVTAKGIRALRLMADGYTAREISEQMGASANNVTAWVSRARRYLREIGRCCI